MRASILLAILLFGCSSQQAPIFENPDDEVIDALTSVPQWHYFFAGAKLTADVELVYDSAGVPGVTDAALQEMLGAVATGWTNATSGALQVHFGGKRFDIDHTVYAWPQIPNNQIEIVFDNNGLYTSPCSGSGCPTGIGGPELNDSLTIVTAGWVAMTPAGLGFGTNALEFEELLSHEVGHALNLQHSCDGPGSNWPCDSSYLDDATMRWMAHFDKRGGSVQQYDDDALMFQQTGVASSRPGPADMATGSGSDMASSPNPTPPTLPPSLPSDATLTLALDAQPVRGQSAPITVTLDPASWHARSDERYTLFIDTLDGANHRRIVRRIGIVEGGVYNLNVRPGAFRGAGDYSFRATLRLSDGSTMFSNEVAYHLDR